jgi:inorganic pyrophosphatase
LEVIPVKYFKITKTWAVKAETEAEAIKLIASAPEKYLDSETVTRTEYKKLQPKAGWGNTIKTQLLGSNSKR